MNLNQTGAKLKKFHHHPLPFPPLFLSLLLPRYTFKKRKLLLFVVAFKYALIMLVRYLKCVFLNISSAISLNFYSMLLSPLSLRPWIEFVPNFFEVNLSFQEMNLRWGGRRDENHKNLKIVFTVFCCSEVFQKNKFCIVSLENTAITLINRTELS